MLSECCTVLVLLLLLAVMLYIRSGVREAALAVLPLTIVPIFHILTGPVVRLLVPHITFPFHFMVIAMDGLGLVIACMAVGVLASWVRSKRLRWFYLVTAGGFSAILDWVLLYNTVGRFL